MITGREAWLRALATVPGTLPGTYSVSVTGTAGSEQITTLVQLKVQ